MDPINPYFRNKIILITGGGGYLGSKFLEVSFEPTASYYLLDLHFNEISRRMAASHQNITLIRADLTNHLELVKALTPVRPELIFHFAALLDRSRDFSVFERLYEVNVAGTMNLLRVFSEVPYERFIFSSTSEVYGSENPVPFHESQPPAALSPYSLTKLMAENIIRTYSDIYQKPWTIARIFNFFGPDMPDSTFIPQLVKAWKENKEFHMTPGEQRRDYLFIDDLVYYLAALSGSPHIQQQIINICSGSAVSMKEIAENIKSVSGNKLKINHSLSYRQNELWDNTGDQNKLLTLLPGHQNKKLEDWIREEFSVSS